MTCMVSLYEKCNPHRKKLFPALRNESIQRNKNGGKGTFLILIFVVRPLKRNKCFVEAPGGLKFELGTDVRPEVSTPGFKHHPITKPEKTKICNLCLNHLFLEGPFSKPISTFYHVNWDAFK